MKNEKSGGVKSAVKSLLVATLCAAITAAFMLIAVACAKANGDISGGFIAFITVCAAVAGILPSAFFAVKRINDQKSINKAINEIYNGNYAVDIPSVGAEYEGVKDAAERLAAVFAAAEKAQTDFITDFSHEIKTPVTSIRGFARLLQSENLTDEQRKEYADVIVAQSARLLDLTANTLMLDRLDNKNFRIEKTEFDVSEVMRQVAVALQESWGEKDIDLCVDADECEIISNEELVYQMLANVFENAVKYTPEGKKITLSARKEGKNAVVCIADEGIGMDEETKARMFDRYFRGDKSRSEVGNGLGLATVKKIAEVLGAKITVDSFPAQGTRFTIIF